MAHTISINRILGIAENESLIEIAKLFSTDPNITTLIDATDIQNN